MSQQTAPSLHLSPHTSTIFCLVLSLGFCASVLFGQGNSDPKKDVFPQWPSIAHLPASCLNVQFPLSKATASQMNQGSNRTTEGNRDHSGPQGLFIRNVSSLRAHHLGYTGKLGNRAIDVANEQSERYWERARSSVSRGTIPSSMGYEVVSKNYQPDVSRFEAEAG